MASTELIRRWTAFNAVGIAGFGVQLGVLAVLVRVLGMHYLPATALAVEAAVLHNFCWHQRWTWKDRPAPTTRSVAGRLARFHAVNGSISLAGNVAMMALLTGVMHVDPIPANIIAILACSLVNFTVSERMVFRSAASPIAGALLILGSPGAAAAGPGSSAIAAWHNYESTLDARYAADSAAGAFFVQDGAGRPRGWRDVVARGDVPLTHVDTPSAGDGRIHHWTGAVFVPGVTLATVLERLKRHAGEESGFYEDVVASKLLARDRDRVKVFMKLRRTTLVTVTYNTEHDVRYRTLGEVRASSRSVATRIAELGGAGTPEEREKRPDEDNGFLWRLNAYWRYEQVPGGVVIECDSVSLSRTVPLLIRPVANPIVEAVARESLEKTLRSLRTFLKSG